MTQYGTIEYNDKRRWASFWHQIDEVLKFRPEKILEIGKGSGVVSDYLRSRGLGVTTFDTDAELRPDVTGSVLAMPFPDRSFDVVLAAQVLEHLPFEDFSKALKEIYRVSSEAAVVSLPHFGPTLRFLIKIPLLPELRFMFKILYPAKHKFKGEHFWEIGKRGFSLRRIKNVIERAGFLIVKDFIVFENPLHHFFILKR